MLSENLLAHNFTSFPNMLKVWSLEHNESYYSATNSQCVLGHFEMFEMRLYIILWPNSCCCWSFRDEISFLCSQRHACIIISSILWICWWFVRCDTAKAATAPRRSGACRSISIWLICGYISSSDLIHVDVALSAMEYFSYALRDVSSSWFYLSS